MVTQICATLAQVMACCLSAPSHYLKQCQLPISEVLWHSPESNFTVSAQATILHNEFENIFKSIATTPRCQWVNTLRPGQHGRHFAEDIFKCIFLNEKVWISIKISFHFVHKGRIDNIPALVLIMAWCWRGNRPISKPMMISLPMRIWITWPQWVYKMFIWQIDCIYQEMGVLTH